MKLKFYPDEYLKKVCKKVEVFDAALHKELDEMKKIMVQFKGMGISANQVGLDKRMFLIETKNELLECINPVIENKKGKANLEEGCLSSPGIFAKIPSRSYELEIIFQNRYGCILKKKLSGIYAVCAEHEMDHLNGIFWFDRLEIRQQRREIERKWKKIKKKLF